MYLVTPYTRIIRLMFCLENSIVNNIAINKLYRDLNAAIVADSSK